MVSVIPTIATATIVGWMDGWKEGRKQEHFVSEKRNHRLSSGSSLLLPLGLLLLSVAAAVALVRYIKVIRQ